MSNAIFRTPICDMFGIEYPVFLAGMGGFISPSGPDLAAAVSAAGGLGVIGGAFVAPEELARQIDQVREMTDKPFGVDTLIPFSVTQGRLESPVALDPTLPETHEQFMYDFAEKYNLGDLPEMDIPVFDPAFIREQLEVVLEKEVPVYVAGLGDPGFLVERAHHIGMKIGIVVGATHHAQKALHSNVDFIVAQGNDGGGHNSRIGTMALIPQVVDAVAGRVPVLGAGSIMDGRGIVAALALGAQGVWCGSAFLATDEAAITQGQKEQIVFRNETGTIISDSFTGKRARLLPSVWADAFRESGLDVLPMHQQLAMTDRVMRAAIRDNRIDVNPGAGGQGIGMVKSIRPAREVFDEMVAQATTILEKGVLGVC